MARITKLFISLVVLLHSSSLRAEYPSHYPWNDRANAQVAPSTASVPSGYRDLSRQARGLPRQYMDQVYPQVVEAAPRAPAASVPQTGVYYSPGYPASAGGNPYANIGHPSYPTAAPNYATVAPNYGPSLNQQYANPQPTEPGNPYAAPYSTLISEPSPHGAVTNPQLPPAEPLDGAPCDDLSSCWGGCRPGWLFSAELLSLQRDEADRFAILTDELSYAPWLDVSSASYDQELGYRVGFTKLMGKGCHCGKWGIELNYLGGFEWSAAAAESGSVALEGPGFRLGLTPSSWQFRYESDLQGAEVNFRSFNCDRFRWFVGYRWLRFNDSLRVDELIAPFPVALALHTENDYHGVQFGTDVMLFNCPGHFRVDGTVKGGIYGNSTRFGAASSLLGPPINCQHSELTFVGEGKLSLVYQLSCKCAIKGGYHVLSLGDIALAPDQIVSTDLSEGWARMNRNTLFLHGAHLGVEFCW